MKEQTVKIFKRFGERIQYVRKTEHITLDELSKQSGLSIGPEIWKQMEGKAGPHMIQGIGAGCVSPIQAL